MPEMDKEGKAFFVDTPQKAELFFLKAPASSIGG